VVPSGLRLWWHGAEGWLPERHSETEPGGMMMRPVVVDEGALLDVGWQQDERSTGSVNFFLSFWPLMTAALTVMRTTADRAHTPIGDRAFGLRSYSSRLAGTFAKSLEAGHRRCRVDHESHRSGGEVVADPLTKEELVSESFRHPTVSSFGHVARTVHST